MTTWMERILHSRRSPRNGGGSANDASLLNRLFESRKMNQWVGPDWMSRPAQVIAICNQKGGCAKTTTAVNLAADLGLRGHPTLLIDLDPQAHASLGLGLDVDRLPRTLYDLFRDPNHRLEEVIYPCKSFDLFIAPANTLLSGTQLELASVPGREQILRHAIQQLPPRFRFILIDCSPSLNLLTLNALAASDFVLAPVQPQYYALEGMRELFATIQLTKERFNPRLKLLGILPVLVDGRLQVAQEILKQIREFFQEQVMKTSIRLHSEIVEASIAGQPVSVYAPGSEAAQDYGELTEEFLERLGVHKTERTNGASGVSLAAKGTPAVSWVENEAARR